jgi:hypothetical protein
MGIRLNWIYNTTAITISRCLTVKNLLVSSTGLTAHSKNDGSKAKGNPLQLDIPEI